MLALTVLRVLPYHGRGATIWERRDGPFFSRAVLWDPVDFSEENLRSFSGELAQEMKGNLAWDVGVFVDRSDLTRELYGKMVTDQGYEWWQKLYIKFGQSLLPMAEFFGYENNIVMRLRDNAGNCSEVTLQGHDFLRVNRDGIEFEILKFFTIHCRRMCHRSRVMRRKSRPMCARLSFPARNRQRSSAAFCKKTFVRNA